jgi:hypothetical protein
MLGCSEGPADHSTKHNANYPDHCVQLNVDTRRLWCYRYVRQICKTYNRGRSSTNF